MSVGQMNAFNEIGDFNDIAKAFVVRWTHQPFSSAVEAAFWHALSQHKVDVLRLSSDALPVTAHYFAGSAGSGDADAVETPARLCLPGSALQPANQHSAPPFAFVAVGQLHNVNTIEAFRTLDKNALFKGVSDQIWNDMVSGKALRSPQLLNRFLLLTFADLKAYKFYYWFAFPAAQSVVGCDWQLLDNRAVGDVLSAAELDTLFVEYGKHRGVVKSTGAATLEEAGYFVVVVQQDGGGVQVHPLHQLPALAQQYPLTQVMVGYADPSSMLAHPGWPLRNLLALVALHLPQVRDGTAVTVRFLSYREQRMTRDVGASRVFSISVTKTADDFAQQQPKFVGWEKNQGKLVPRMADLGPLMDPLRLASTSVDLNLKLMKWRLMPELDLDKIQQQKCLLLGAGTLGCYVARSLLAWGIRHITFVDSGNVSFSNPVRQPLFLYEDCLNGGKAKAMAAAERMREIFPGVICEGHQLSIPMPGHPVPADAVGAVTEQIKTLERLIQAHDVVYLLMDSRESRWLPSVLGCYHDKLVMTVALGFDTYVVMRHGPKGQVKPRLGCYFCNDVVAPTDSLKDRTLDQQCTVTRPGLSAIASAQAVELAVSLATHKHGKHAPAATADDSNSSPLGIVPHQIRGFLGQFNNMLVTGEAYNRCTACSDTIMTAFQQDGTEFVLQVCGDSGVLERVTGLDALHAEAEALDVEGWTADDGEEEF
ncbi:Autophagy protein 7 [Sorochytrium milnesiophthora]